MCTGEGWLDVATARDLRTHIIVRWAMPDHMRSSLCVKALAMTRGGAPLDPKAVFRSDRGSQYTSIQIQKWCAASSIRQSIGGAGACWDNAAADSFLIYLK